ncbi:hypothetical protein Lal_00002037 [Lupinus albus]|nr:hypothetical protein Lal_00002037 [Lupinus albus]
MRWSREAYSSYSLDVLYFNNSALPSEFYEPIGLQVSQAQTFTFLVRDRCLGDNVGSSQGHIGLSKYLMRSSIEEVIFGEKLYFFEILGSDDLLAETPGPT